MDPLTDQLPIKQSDYPCRTTYQHTRRLRLSVDADSLAGRADRSGDLRRPRGLESRPRQGRPDRPAARRRRPGGRSTSTWPRRRRPTASSVRALASWEATTRRKGEAVVVAGVQVDGPWQQLPIKQSDYPSSSSSRSATSTSHGDEGNKQGVSRDAQGGRSTAVERRRRGLLV